VFHVKLNTRSILEVLGEDQIGLLRRYATLLRDRALPLGLVSPGDVDRLWERHVVDSLRGISCVVPADSRVVDVGSGAGLPGIPLAIALPQAQFTLVEAKQRRAGFLELAAAELGLPNVSVAPVPANELGAKVPLCVVRALGSAPASWLLASPLLEEGGRLLYWAGRSWGEDAADELASLGVAAEICLASEFQWQGPLVIMRQFSPSNPQRS
jgi:16S rRNA (guanine527-N7)-methyltransferase